MALAEASQWAQQQQGCTESGAECAESLSLLHCLEQSALRELSGMAFWRVSSVSQMQTVEGSVQDTLRSLQLKKHALQSGDGTEREASLWVEREHGQLSAIETRSSPAQDDSGAVVAGQKAAQGVAALSQHGIAQSQTLMELRNKSSLQLGDRSESNELDAEGGAGAADVQGFLLESKHTNGYLSQKESVFSLVVHASAASAKQSQHSALQTDGQRGAAVFRDHAHRRRHAPRLALHRRHIRIYL
jgi:hypothetical protein